MSHVKTCITLLGKLSAVITSLSKYSRDVMLSLRGG